MLRNTMNPKHHQKNCFLTLGIICLAYLIFEGFYVFYTTLSLDDFWLSYHNYQYQSALPYRDFSPYKTVLGYYLFLIPLSLFHGTIAPLIYTKFCIAIINAFFMGFLGVWLRKFFDSRAVFSALVLVILMQIFLFYSVDIRVDIIAYWLCLTAVLFVFEEKYIVAGLTIGLSFLVSQKAVWYVIAINCGLVCHWLIEDRHWQKLKEIVIFNFSALVILTSYILFWAYFSSLHKVLESVFYEAYLISSVNWFHDLRYYYWRYIVDNNPGLILLWPIAFFGLFVLPVKKRVFIISYAAVIVIFIIQVKQPFAYYLLAGIPVYLVGYSAFLTAIFSGSKPSKIGKKLIFIFSFLYVLYLQFLSLKLAMPSSYLLAVFIPISLIILYSVDPDIRWRAIFHRLILCVALLLGIIFPLIIAAILVPETEGRYQKAMVYLVKDLLISGGGTYIAGVPLLHDIKQPVPGLEHIVGPSVAYLKRPTRELTALMQLKSLYFSPDTTPQIIASIKGAPVKLYVDNNRFHFLPQEIHEYLASQYQHFWGSIFLYAPLVPVGEQSVYLKFAGDYQVEADKDAQIYIAKEKVVPGAVVSLQAQSYLIKASKAFRLRFIPSRLEHPLEMEFKANDWQRVLSWN